MHCRVAMTGAAGVIFCDIWDVDGEWWNRGAMDFGFPLAALIGWQVVVMGAAENARYKGFMETGSMSGFLNQFPFDPFNVKKLDKDMEVKEIKTSVESLCDPGLLKRAGRECEGHDEVVLHFRRVGVFYGWGSLWFLTFRSDLLGIWIWCIGVVVFFIDCWWLTLGDLDFFFSGAARGRAERDGEGEAGPRAAGEQGEAGLWVLEEG